MRNNQPGLTHTGVTLERTLKKKTNMEEGYGKNLVLDTTVKVGEVEGGLSMNKSAFFVHQHYVY